jgi:hypothetical protein
MSYQAITIDPEQKEKVDDEHIIIVPEDAYTINDSKKLCITIHEGGFCDTVKKSLVFVFSDDNIIVTQDYVEIIGGYQLDEFQDILSIAQNSLDLNANHNHLNILNKMFEMYLCLSNRRRSNRNKRITTNILLKVILTDLNKAIGSYYGLPTVNLKESKFTDFYNEVTMKKMIVLK